jgi:hypothetical protein
MAQLAIKGHATRGEEVIRILEMLGGINETEYNGVQEFVYYFINNNYIDWCHEFIPGSDFICFTLEEFLEEFPYKVGDKVNYVKYNDEYPDVYKYPDVYTIQGMRWVGTTIEYLLDSSGFSVLTKDLQPYKEETMDKAIKAVFDAKVQCCDIMNDIIKKDMEEIKIEIPAGYEFVGIDDDNQQVVFTKIQPEYPKTFDECSVVLSELPHTTLISSFYKLLVCRDAYWQIAGWKFNYDEKCYYLCPELGEIQKYEGVCDCNAVLAFPTKEIRDMFLENFRELINQCKELL